MGKTSIALNLAKNVAQLHDMPVCLFSLETVSYTHLRAHETS